VSVLVKLDSLRIGTVSPGGQDWTVIFVIEGFVPDRLQLEITVRAPENEPNMALAEAKTLLQKKIQDLAEAGQAFVS
jgi:hypothetical protein